MKNNRGGAENAERRARLAWSQWSPLKSGDRLAFQTAEKRGQTRFSSCREKRGQTRFSNCRKASQSPFFGSGLVAVVLVFKPFAPERRVLADPVKDGLRPHVPVSLFGLDPLVPQDFFAFHRQHPRVAFLPPFCGMVCHPVAERFFPAYLTPPFLGQLDPMPFNGQPLGP